jgi:hypothetical protein
VLVLWERVIASISFFWLGKKCCTAVTSALIPRCHFAPAAGGSLTASTCKTREIQHPYSTYGKESCRNLLIAMINKGEHG